MVSGLYALRLRTIRPKHANGIDRDPVIMYFHGAGWVMGDATTHDRLVRELAVGANATVMFVDYDRAPEHRYPVAIEEAYAATCYVSEHAQEFDIDATRLAVAGDSVGGNMQRSCRFLQSKGLVLQSQVSSFSIPSRMPILRAAPTNSSLRAPGLRGGRCSGSGTSIFLITTSAGILPLLRCWHRRSNSLAYRARSSSRPRMTCCAMKVRHTAAS